MSHLVWSRNIRFHLGRGSFGLRFTYAMPVLARNHEDGNGATVHPLRSCTMGLLQAMVVMAADGGGSRCCPARQTHRQLHSSDDDGGESFLRVHWVAVPQAMRARRANRRRIWGRGRCGGGQGQVLQPKASGVQPKISIAR
eukprot:COSAG01_NODE_229_length_21089_cov_575.019194_23_plen_141_part_00